MLVLQPFTQKKRKFALGYPCFSSVSKTLKVFWHVRKNDTKWIFYTKTELNSMAMLSLLELQSILITSWKRTLIPSMLLGFGSFSRILMVQNIASSYLNTEQNIPSATLLWRDFGMICSILLSLKSRKCSSSSSFFRCLLHVRSLLIFHWWFLQWLLLQFERLDFLFLFDPVLLLLLHRDLSGFL